MCFTIDHSAKAPTQTTAFKVVMLKKWGRGHTRVPPIYRENNIRYTEGAVVRSGYKKNRFNVFSSERGIYVLLTIEAAGKLLEHYGYLGHEIIQVKVSPKDWICSPIKTGHQIHDHTAAYRKVKVL